MCRATISKVETQKSKRLRKNFRTDLFDHEQEYCLDIRTSSKLLSIKVSLQK